MSNIVHMRQTGALTRRDPRRLDLFRKTVGKELRGDEIDEAIEWCELYGANPFVKDIYFFVFDADKPEKRRVVPVLGIGLYRKIAARTGNYRPDETAPRFIYDDNAKSLANPTGMVSCEVSVNVHSHGEWHKVTSRMRWEERAPIIMEGAEGFKYVDTGDVWEDSGKPKKKKVPVGDVVAKLDPNKKNWHTMPETMMAKCTEADAIRKAWPNETAGSYVQEEMDAAHTIDLTATEIAETYASEQRIKQIGAANSILIDWLDNAGIVQCPVGQLGDKAIAWIKANAEEPMTVTMWRDRNRHALQEYWGRDKAGALELKKVLESVLNAAE
jgi:phage recombination protein Bet